MDTALTEKGRDTTGFGPRLRTIREQKGLTQKALGEKAGMLYQVIARLERGARTPSWETVLKLAEALRVEPNDFMT